MPQSSANSQKLAHGLCAIFGSDRVSQSNPDRLAYSRDMWPQTLLALRDDRPMVYPPDFVVWPESTQEIVELVKFAARDRIPIVPWGAGSGVCGGAAATCGGIIVDLKRMNRLLSISIEDHLAAFESGIIGQTLEDTLNIRGLTLGHFPASIYCSTLGGWLATRSAGQFSSLYGNIEDMVECIEAVTGDGRVLKCHSHDQPELAQILVGSEGTLGIITAAEIRVHPLPSHRIFHAYEFPNVTSGMEAMRRIMQRGLKPAVLRLYDRLDTLLARSGGQGAMNNLLHSATNQLPFSNTRVAKGLHRTVFKTALGHAGLLGKLAENVMPNLKGGCLLILGCQGEKTLTETEITLCHAEMIAMDAKDLGEEPGLEWYKHRYDVSYKQSPLYASSGFADTMEFATTWKRLPALYESVKRALSPYALVLAHFSHAYQEGCSIYFTFAAASEGRHSSENLYNEIWRQGLSAAIKVGATISHHHGIGVNKAAFMAHEHGESMAIFRQLKKNIDPQGILNPGKMGL
ncbi:MAG: FAD-binding oxidoreductase [Pseudomonadota bacterium]